MAITPRTIFTNPASATLATASLMALTAAGLYALENCPSSCSASKVKVAKTVIQTAPCDDVKQALGHDRSAWSEKAWFTYANCFDKHNDSRRVVEAASQGIRYYPSSEALYNLKGYHLITMKKYAQAVRTLEEGLRRVGVPSSGTMANNLAWAGLWAPREMKRQRARQLYKLSLRYEANVCETLHTGLWVEYAIAKESKGLARAEALRNFNTLKTTYNPCTTRYMNGQWDAMIEVLGAAVVIEDLEHELNKDASFVKCKSKRTATPLIKKVSKELRKRYRGTSIDSLCRESIPVATAHHTCINIIDKNVTQLRRNKIVFF